MSQTQRNEGPLTRAGNAGVHDNIGRSFLALGGGEADPHANVPGAPPLGGGGDPHGGGAAVPDTVPQQTAAKSLEKTADGRSVLGPFTLVAPKEWSEKPVTSSMRAAQYTWSEKSGEQAELVVYYFGEGGAGGL